VVPPLCMKKNELIITMIFNLFGNALIIRHELLLAFVIHT
jgi:hypothetical protein